MQSAGRAYNAPISNINLSSSGQPTSLLGKRIDTSDSSLRQMSRILRERVKTRDCQIRLTSPNAFLEEMTLGLNPGLTQGIKRTFILLRVWGDKRCPINLDFKITTLMEPSIGRWAVSYDYSYLVADPSYKDMNDVDAIELHGGISTNGINTSRVRSETDLKGSIHSQSLGTISLQSYGKLEGASLDAFSGETVWKFGYADFAAEFHKKYDKGRISFLINQEDVDSDEFDKYFAQGGDPFIYGANSDLVH